MQQNILIMKCNTWRVLQRLFMVVLVVACSFSSTRVRCDIAIGSEINKGPLTLDAAAVAKLSKNPNQAAWWQLADEAWHDSAIDRFFSIGPPDATQMPALASAWKHSGINISGSTPANDLIKRLQDTATTEYKMNKSITGTGAIAASMWTLMFHCMSPSCTDGYMAPIVVVPTPKNDSNFSYATVWLPATDKLLMNAIPAFISTPVKKVQPVDPDKLGLFPVFNIHNISQCPPPSAYAFRTLLDSAYGLAPAIYCQRFAEDQSFKIVVVSGNQSTKFSKKQRSWPFKVSKLLPLPLEECFKMPLMMVDVPGWYTSYSRMCHHSRCITFSFKSTPTNNSKSHYTGLQALKSMQSILEGLSQCAPASTGFINTTACNAFEATAFVLDFLDEHYYFSDSDTSHFKDFSHSFSGASKWVKEQVMDTHDSQFAPNLKNTEACYMLLDSPSLYNGNSSDVTPPKEIKIQAMAYLTSYITEHNAAFTTDKGPSTDPYTFYALIVSTALSVITIAVPFTNFMLYKVCHRYPRYLKPSRKAVKIIMQVCCNVGLSFAFLLPVISLARNELDRENTFSTWALASDDLVYGQISTSSDPIRVFYFFSATSKYKSHFLTVILLVICLTCVPVAASTTRRCLQVFASYALLCKDSHSSEAPSESDQRALLKKAMKAIEMGEAEYLDLKDKVAGNQKKRMVGSATGLE